MKRGLARIVRGHFAGLFAVVAAASAPAAAGDEVTAVKSVMVQKTGPRGGDNASKYFNVQGKQSGGDGKFACFGVLEFAAPKAGPRAEAPKGMTLTLVQSLPRFAKDGKVRFYLTTDTRSELEPADGPAGRALKFDEAAADGLGNQLPPRHALGSGTFRKAETGHADSFSLALDDAARAYVKGQVDKGGTIRLIVVPDDDEVAATYSGAGAPTPASRPKLALEVGAAR
jgi:hypothetical protein